MRREHARLVGRIIFSDLLEYPLKRYKKMIEEVEASPLMSRLPVTFKYLSQTGRTLPLAKRQRGGRACQVDKGSTRVIAEIVKNGRALKIRYAYEGFNKKFWISGFGMWNEPIVECLPAIARSQPRQAGGLRNRKIRNR